MYQSILYLILCNQVLDLREEIIKLKLAPLTLIAKILCSTNLPARVSVPNMRASFSEIFTSIVPSL